MSKDAQDHDLAPIFRGLSKSQKLSEIKQPLVFEDFSYSIFLSIWGGYTGKSLSEALLFAGNGENM